MSPVDHDGARRIRVLFAVGLVINFAGFVYDWAWHSWNLSLEVIPPTKLLVVHGAIYLGAFIVTFAAVQALTRRVFGALVERIGLWVLVAGLLLEFLGDATDMWAHGHGYEKDLYHDFVYNGAGLTLLGYLIIELFQIFRAGTPDDAPSEPSAVEGTSNEPSAADGPSTSVDAGRRIAS